jgi:hypothetical protein
MSRKKTPSLATVERGIANAQRALFFEHLYADTFCRRKREGKKSVRAVADGDNVELVSADGSALDAVYNALTSNKGEVTATKLRDISEDEVTRLQDPRDWQTAQKQLKAKR